MKSHKNYDADECIKILSAKKVIFTDHINESPIIDISKASNLGNNSWGRIGYLQRYHGYKLIGLAEYQKQYGEQEEAAPIKLERPLIKNQKKIINELL